MRTAELCREFDLQVQNTGFPLHPDTPDSGMTLEEMFAGRFDLNAAMVRLRQVARELNLPFGDRSMTYNSRRAQELAKWAELMGLGPEFHAAVYRAYFVDGLNIASLEVLTDIAGGIGLDADQAGRVIMEKSYAEAVDADWRRSRALDVTAVPTVRYGDRRLVGFQPYQAYRTLISGS